MARKNLFQKMEDLKDNIEFFGLGSGIANTILDSLDESLDRAEEKMNRTFDRLEEMAENPIQLLRLPLMDLSFERPCSKKKLEPGDIIAATRKPLGYQHFAVYIGDDKVIHFAADNGDWAGEPYIHEASFGEFLRDSDGFDILEFSETRKTPERYEGILPCMATSAMLISVPIDAIGEVIRNVQHHLYSPKETVERAKMVANQCAQEGSKIETWINGHKYNLIFNNCEHFAIWCKTGVHESRQVDKILKFFTIPKSALLELN